MVVVWGGWMVVVADGMTRARDFGVARVTGKTDMLYRLPIGGNSQPIAQTRSCMCSSHVVCLAAHHVQCVKWAAHSVFMLPRKHPKPLAKQRLKQKLVAAMLIWKPHHFRTHAPLDHNSSRPPFDVNFQMRPYVVVGDGSCEKKYAWFACSCLGE